MTIEELLEKPYWIIDILPERVPEGTPGQYFAVEKYFLKKKQRASVKDRHIGLVLRLNCYRELIFGEEGERNPAPEKIAGAMRSETVWLRTGDAFRIWASMTEAKTSPQNSANPAGSTVPFSSAAASFARPRSRASFASTR